MVYVKLSADDERRIVERIVDGVVRRLAPRLGVDLEPELSISDEEFAATEARVKVLRASLRQKRSAERRQEARLRKHGKR